MVGSVNENIVKECMTFYPMTGVSSHHDFLDREVD